MAVGAVAVVGLAEMVAQRRRQKREQIERQQPMENAYEDDNEEEERPPMPSAPPLPPPPLPLLPSPPARTELAPGGGAPLELPKVCSLHPNCLAPGCERLHLCLQYLAGLCRLGDRCRRGHSLTTVHNQVRPTGH